MIGELELSRNEHRLIFQSSAYVCISIQCTPQSAIEVAIPSVQCPKVRTVMGHCLLLFIGLFHLSSFPDRLRRVKVLLARLKWDGLTVIGSWRKAETALSARFLWLDDQGVKDCRCQGRSSDTIVLDLRALSLIARLGVEMERYVIGKIEWNKTGKWDDWNKEIWTHFLQ